MTLPEYDEIPQPRVLRPRLDPWVQPPALGDDPVADADAADAADPIADLPGRRYREGTDEELEEKKLLHTDRAELSLITAFSALTPQIDEQVLADAVRREMDMARYFIRRDAPSAIPQPDTTSDSTYIPMDDDDDDPDVVVLDVKLAPRPRVIPDVVGVVDHLPVNPSGISMPSVYSVPPYPYAPFDRTDPTIGRIDLDAPYEPIPAQEPIPGQMTFRTVTNPVPMPSGSSSSSSSSDSSTSPVPIFMPSLANPLTNPDGVSEPIQMVEAGRVEVLPNWLRNYACMEEKDKPVIPFLAIAPFYYHPLGSPAPTTPMPDFNTLFASPPSTAPSTVVPQPEPEPLREQLTQPLIDELTRLVPQLAGPLPAGSPPPQPEQPAVPLTPQQAKIYTPGLHQPLPGVVVESRPIPPMPFIMPIFFWPEAYSYEPPRIVRGSDIVITGMRPGFQPELGPKDEDFKARMFCIALEQLENRGFSPDGTPETASEVAARYIKAVGLEHSASLLERRMEVSEQRQRKKRKRPEPIPEDEQAQEPVFKKRRSPLPMAALITLREWFVAHLMHPYPRPAEKAELCRLTTLTLTQLNNWFANIRKRFWLPFEEQIKSDKLKPSVFRLMLTSPGMSQAWVRSLLVVESEGGVGGGAQDDDDDDDYPPFDPFGTLNPTLNPTSPPADDTAASLPSASLPTAASLPAVGVS